MTDLKKIPATAPSLQRMCYDLANPELTKKDLAKEAKNIDKVLAFAVAMMKKHKFICDVDMSRRNWGFETYKNPEDPSQLDEDEIVINYRYMWKIAFIYATALFFKRSYEIPFLNRDLVTVSLLCNSSTYCNRISTTNCSNWNEHRDAMIDDMTSDASAMNFATALALRSMDAQFVVDHKDIFNALSKEDDVALAAIFAR